jgi:hypothetical protein
MADMSDAIRDALFEHDMFDPAAGGASYGLDHIRNIEATWAFEASEITSALARMTPTEIVLTDNGYWTATRAGLIAREARWHQLGRRHPALSSETFDLEDLALAIIASGGEDFDTFQSNGLAERALSVHLFRFGDAACEAAITALSSRGLVRRIDDGIASWPAKLILSADGRRRYAHKLVPQLGLQPPSTILAAMEPERLPFDELGLDPMLADNFRFRWEEAGRCMNARAWLAATILYGSILEVVLPDWLGRDIERSRAAQAAPRDKQKQILPLEKWSLVALITVTTELGWIDESIARHAQALRESRNLIHPGKQIRERSSPDGNLASISQQVVRAVLDALARAAAVDLAGRGEKGMTNTLPRYYQPASFEKS